MPLLNTICNDLVRYRQSIMCSFVLAYYLDANKETASFLSRLAGLELAANQLSNLLRENSNFENVPLSALLRIKDQVDFIKARARRLFDHVQSIDKPEVEWFRSRLESLTEDDKPSGKI